MYFAAKYINFAVRYINLAVRYDVRYPFPSCGPYALHNTSMTPWCIVETGDMTSLTGHPPLKLLITSNKSWSGGLSIRLHKQSSESVPGSKHSQCSELWSILHLKCCSLFSMFAESRMNKEAKTSLFYGRKYTLYVSFTWHWRHGRCIKVGLGRSSWSIQTVSKLYNEWIIHTIIMLVRCAATGPQ